MNPCKKQQSNHVQLPEIRVPRGTISCHIGMVPFSPPLDTNPGLCLHAKKGGEKKEHLHTNTVRALFLSYLSVMREK